MLFMSCVNTICLQTTMCCALIANLRQSHLKVNFCCRITWSLCHFCYFSSDLLKWPYTLTTPSQKWVRQIPWLHLLSLNPFGKRIWELGLELDAFGKYIWDHLRSLLFRPTFRRMERICTCAGSFLSFDVLSITCSTNNVNLI